MLTAQKMKQYADEHNNRVAQENEETARKVIEGVLQLIEIEAKAGYYNTAFSEDEVPDLCNILVGRLVDEKLQDHGFSSNYDEVGYILRVYWD